MNDHVTAYPLCWPAHKPRTLEGDRKYGRFCSKRSNGYGVSDITVHQAIGRIRDELDTMDGPQRHWQRIDPDSIVISTNLRVRTSDGGIVSGQKAPQDPGAALYFTMDSRQQCVAVDSYTHVAQNLAAIAAVISALRSLERHGSGLMEAAFTGFSALPSPDAIVMINWRTVLDYDGNDLAEAEIAYRRARSKAHNDKGGDSEQFHAVQEAWRQAQQELS